MGQANQLRTLCIVGIHAYIRLWWFVRVRINYQFFRMGYNLFFLYSRCLPPQPDVILFGMEIALLGKEKEFERRGNNATRIRHVVIGSAPRCHHITVAVWRLRLIR
jgi:hypothetical protein